MTNLERAQARALATQNATLCYFATSPQDVRNRLAPLLMGGTFDSAALLYEYPNGSMICFVTAKGRPEQQLGMHSLGLYFDEKTLNGTHSVGGTVHNLADEQLSKGG